MNFGFSNTLVPLNSRPQGAEPATASDRRRFW